MCHVLERAMSLSTYICVCQPKISGYTHIVNILQWVYAYTRVYPRTTPLHLPGSTSGLSYMMMLMYSGEHCWGLTYAVLVLQISVTRSR